MKKSVFVIFSLVGCILFFALAGADFVIDDDFSSIALEYLEGDMIRGNMNMSFNEQVNARFLSNFEGGIRLLSLLELLNYTAKEDFACEPVNCLDDYNSFLGNVIQRFLLEENKTALYGFRTTAGEILGIDSLVFNFSVTDSMASCENQLAIDLFNDGVPDFYNTMATSNTCGERDFGCYDDNPELVIEEAIIGNVFYCEKVTLPPAPGYRIGAIIRGVVPNPQGNLQLSLHYLNGEGLGSGEVTNPISGSEISVDVVNLALTGSFASFEPFNALICITDPDNRQNYAVHSKVGGDAACGGVLTQSGIGGFNTDFELFAQPLEYDPIKETRFDRDYYFLATGEDLDARIDDYWENTYALDCPSPGCIIPFAFHGKAGQEIELHSVLFRYRKGNGAISQTDNAYKLVEKPFIISSDYLMLELAPMNFSVPREDGNHEFYLCLDVAECTEGNAILHETISVEVGFDFSIEPLFALVGRKTAFTAFTSENITASRWKFGDESTLVNSNDNKAQHAYVQEGNYTLEVILINARGEESIKRFRVVVGDAMTSANLTMSEYESRIAGIRESIRVFPQWIENRVVEQIKLDESEALLAAIEDDFELANNDEDYSDIITRLLEIEIPLSVSVTELVRLSAAIGYDVIDINHIAEVSGVETAHEGETRSAIILWIEKNYDLEIELETVSVFDESGGKPLLTRYEIDLTQKPSSDGDTSFLIVDYLPIKLEFKSLYGEETVSDDTAVSIPVDGSGSPEKVEFIVLGENPPTVEDLGVYVSPVLSEFGATGLEICSPGDPACDVSGGFNWSKFLIGVAILFVVAFAMYIVLQSWYKRYYERHLFKNPNDLYNVVYFTYNSRKAGMHDSDIKKRLLGKKWTREQINYALKKIDGKRTGMWEIPVFKFAENKKVKKEIQKKQHGVEVDTRFIKRGTFRG